MVDRNTIVGIDLLVIGVVVSALGFIAAQSIPITAFGFAVAIIGALVLLIVPEPVPQDAYKALLSDSIRNLEIILEESNLKERAYFYSIEDEVRALIPLSINETEESIGKNLVQSLSRAPKRFITDLGHGRWLILIPPGNEIVKRSKIQKEDDLEEALRSVLVGFSDLAASVLAVEEGNAIKIQIDRPKLFSDSPFFNQCLGSPVSCIACCAVARVKGVPVKILDEKSDPALVRITLETLEVKA